LLPRLFTDTNLLPNTSTETRVKLTTINPGDEALASECETAIGSRIFSEFTSTVIERDALRKI